MLAAHPPNFPPRLSPAADGFPYSVALGPLKMWSCTSWPRGWPGRVRTAACRCKVMHTGREAPVQRTGCEATQETTPALCCLAVYTPSVFARHSFNSDRAADFKHNKPQAELLV